MTEETEIKKQIKDYLKLKRVFFWYNLAGIGAYKGIPDISAIHNGKFYGIEVKKRTGHLSEHQEEFKIRCEDGGGVYVTARKVEDVMELIK